MKSGNPRRLTVSDWVEARATRIRLKQWKKACRRAELVREPEEGTSGSGSGSGKGADQCF
jgi:hypothetical protein